MKEYNAIVRIVDEQPLKLIAEQFYDDDLEAAVIGELAWTAQSGLEIEIQEPVNEPMPTSSINSETEELELTEEMVRRNDEIDKAVWECINTLTEQETEWNMEVIGRVTDAIKDVLKEYNLKVRHPAIETDEDGNQRYVE